MASRRIGRIKDGKKVTPMSNKDLQDMLDNPNTRGRDAHKIRMELLKRKS